MSNDFIDYRDFATVAGVWTYTPKVPEQRWYYLKDALGSVMGLIGSHPNASSEFHLYDVYGKPNTTSAVGNPYVFAGKRIDLYGNNQSQAYMENRILNFYTGRWMTIDPLGVNPNGGIGNKTFQPIIQTTDGMNIYEYVQNNPITGYDPFGLSNYALGYFVPLPRKHRPKEGDGWGLKRSERDADDIRLLANLKKYGTLSKYIFPNASKYLLHYAGNTGNMAGADVFDLVMKSNIARDHLLKELKAAMSFAEGNANSAASEQNIPKGEQVHFYISSQNWDDREASDNLDWKLAINNYDGLGLGDVTRLSNCKYRMKFTFMVSDRYDWLPGTSFFDGRFTGDELHQLHDVGLAREFNVIGQTNFGITWRKGKRLEKWLFRFGLPKGSFNLNY